MKWYFDTALIDSNQHIINRLEEKKQKLAMCRPLPESVLHKIKSELSLEWTYHSNNIEGNTLNLNETRVVLEHGMTIKGKTLKEHLEIVNHHEAIDYVGQLVNTASMLSQNDILELHRIVMTHIEKDFAGRFRNGGVRIGGAGFVPPNALKVFDLMADLLQNVHTHYDTWPVLWLATLYHHHFVYIHPFFDGNGRTVRLSMNVLLMKAGYPPAIILQQDRKKYYAALEIANKGDYQRLFLLMLQAAERSLNIYVHALPTQSEDDDYALISEIVSKPSIPYAQEYISNLARKGLIDAYKEGRNWLTRRSAILEYWQSKQSE